jgi:prepilin-type N-terminal cleavage/methylation domain-containing protein
MFSQRPRRALTLIELLVVLAIIGVLVGLLIPAVMHVRERASRAACQNKLRQIAFASHSFHDVNNSFPPGIGYFRENTGQPDLAGPIFGNGFVHLLPFLELGAVQRISKLWSDPALCTVPIAIYMCPSDPTVGGPLLSDGVGREFATASYAGNAQVFCTIGIGWAVVNVQNMPRLSRSFEPDGTSNTILFAEKYARCTNETFPVGGTCWAYSQFYQPGGILPVPLHPGFAIKWLADSVGEESVFLSPTDPKNCDPTRASTSHPGGIQVAMADASVHSLARSISPTTWWAICTPANGDVPGVDWPP